MITTAVKAGVPALWLAGDEVYGADPRLRRAVRVAGLGYVLQFSANRRVPTGAGPLRVDELAPTVPARAWQKASAGRGSKGERVYSWAWIAIGAEDDADPASGQHHLLIRRNDTTGELAYHRCYTPTPVPLMTLVRVAGQRWRIEESFQAGKGLTGLDQHQVRRWISWHRWTTLAMLAHAFLVVTDAADRDHAGTPTGPSHSPSTSSAGSSTPSCSAQPTPSPACCTGLPGAEDTKPAPRMPLPTPRTTMIMKYGCKTSL